MSWDAREALEALLGGEESALPLDEAALAIAAIEFPDLRARACLEALDAHAKAIARAGGSGFRTEAERHLFQREGFRGNDNDYYDPRNSCLNWVLESKRGIPISLSVLYMELGRRLGVEVNGIAAPGHFVVRLLEEGDVYYIDPFRGGAIRDDLEEELPATVLRPATKRVIVLRMLNNLRQIYLNRRAWRKAELVLDWILRGEPLDRSAWQQRAAARIGLRRYRDAVRDLEQMLALKPDTDDRKEIETQIRQLREMQSLLN